MFLAILIVSSFALSASATPLARKTDARVMQQSDKVRCYSETKCDGVGKEMTMRECCLSAAMLSYSTTGGLGTCNECTVYGWLKESLQMKERIRPYELGVGYIKGSGSNLKFRVIVEEHSTHNKQDYTVTPQLLTVRANTAPAIVEVDTYLDGVALEPDEKFKLKLELLNDPQPGFFQDTINLTIIDTNELEVSLTSVEYRASEGAKAMAIGVKKDKQIATPLSITITPRTVAQAETWTDVTLPVIPADNHFSPNRATDMDDSGRGKNKDFENSLVQLEFLPDQYSPVNEITADVSIIDDDLNEAYEEYFVVRVDPTHTDNSLVKITGPQASLCKIVDNDPIRLGFTVARQTISRPEYYQHYEVEVASEDNRVSQQDFTMIIQAIAASPSPDIGVVSNEMLNTLLGGDRIILHQFRSYSTNQKVYFEIDPYFLPDDIGPVAFELVISGAEHPPYFLQANNLHQSMFVVIE